MIRNLLYSVSLHLVLIAAIFLSFNTKTPPDNNNEISKISISFAAKPQKPKIEEVKKEIKKEPKKKKEKKKKKPEKKPKIKKKPKKEKETKPKKKEKKKEETPDKNKNEEPTKTDEKKQEKELEKPKPTAYDIIKNKKDIKSLDLSSREKFNIETEIRRCFRTTLKNNKTTNKVPVSVYLQLEPDGSINLESAIFQNVEKYNDPLEKDLHHAINNVKESLIFCSPLRSLPKEKYNIWKYVDMTFKAEQ